MTTTWEEASRCPRDGAYTGIVKGRKFLKGQGQLVSLECPEDNCPYHVDGWIVQVRPDGTIPDAVPAEQREKFFIKSPGSAARKRQILDALAEQAEAETKNGAEV